MMYRANITSTIDAADVLDLQAAAAREIQRLTVESDIYDKLTGIDGAYITARILPRLQIMFPDFKVRYCDVNTHNYIRAFFAATNSAPAAVYEIVLTEYKTERRANGDKYRLKAAVTRERKAQLQALVNDLPALIGQYNTVVNCLTTLKTTLNPIFNLP